MIDFPNTPVVGQVFNQWVWDGAAWTVATAAIPGPWLDLTLTASFTASPTAKYRLRGDQVDIKYSVAKTAVAGLVIATLPLGCRPPVEHKSVHFINTFSEMMMSVHVSGNIEHMLTTSPGVAGDIFISGLTTVFLST